MAKTYFRIDISVARKGGRTELVFPDVLKELEHQIIQVPDGGQEAVVVLDISRNRAAELERHPAFTRLPARDRDCLLKGYPRPKLKRQFRKGKPTPVHGGGEDVVETEHELDEQGRPIVETYQTVRFGYHLIDVPVSVEER